MSDLYCVRFLQNHEDWNKGTCQEMIASMASPLLEQGIVEEITEKEVREHEIQKQAKHSLKKVEREMKKSIIERERMTVEEIAKDIIDSTPLYYDREKKWYLFKEEEKQWLKIDEIDVMGFIKNTFNMMGLSTISKRAEMLNALKDEARMREPKELEDTEIQIGKLIYDITTDITYECDRTVKPRIIIPHNINEVKEETCPKIDKLFEDWVGQDKQVLYDIVAFCMSPKYFLDVCFWLVGKGENGKGLFQTVINRVVGIENVTSQDLELISDPKDRFTKCFIRDKLVCSLGDGNKGVINHTKAIKSLSGCTDLIRAEIKGGHQADFFNQAKLVGAFNTLPQTNDKTDGFYRRQHITEFKNNFIGMKNPLPDVPQEEYAVLAKICWKRLQQMYKDNELTNWGTIDDRKEKYERLSNPIALFIKNKLNENDHSYIFPSVIHKEYEKFAVKKGYSSFRKGEFEARLSNEGYEKRRKDVFHHENLCWGREKDIPEDIKFIYEQQGFIPKEKLHVWYGLNLKIDTLDTLDSKNKLDPLRKGTNLKKLSKVSKVSIIDFVGDKHVSVMDLIKEFGAEVEQLIDDMRRDGNLYETKKGYVARL